MLSSPELINSSFSFAYNYMTETEANALKDLLYKNLFKLNYDHKTTKLSWSNPNNIFTEFRFYFKKVPGDLNDECVLQLSESFVTITTTEFTLLDYLPLSKYKVNIVGTKTQQMEFFMLIKNYL